MTHTLRSIFFSILLVGLFASCSSPDALYDLSNESFTLLNADSSEVNFPNAYKGNITVISFIFTNCPDVCPAITANMKNIQTGLTDTSNINFVEISFDPERDTPSVLADYKDLYRLNEQFTMLTGDTATVGSLLKKLEIIAVKTFPDSTGQDSSSYSMRHSNTIYLMDEEGRIRSEYFANVVPAEHVIEDIQTLGGE